ncbi:MAG: hypothetical protein ACLP1Y_07135 [Candidatus Acidiferrales bacterium]
MRRDIHRFLKDYTQVQSLPPGEKTALAAPVPAAADWAIVVTHGMGQQLHFETLEQIAVSLRSAELRARGAANDIVPRVVRLRDGNGKETELVRAEMNVTASDGQERTVHVYESYWAPLTEGQATLRDVTAFMLESFLRGLWFLVGYRKFDRWEFGGLKRFAIHFLLSLGKLLAAILIFLGPLALANLLTVGQVASFALHGGKGQVILESWTKNMGWVEVFIGVFGAGALIFPKLYRSKFLAGRAGFWRTMRSGVKVLAIAVSLAGILGVFGAELAFIHPIGGQVTKSVQIVVWVGALLEGLIGRWFLIEYMGDVAVYVTSFKVSRWDEVRDKIKKTVAEVVGAVYGARSGGDPDQAGAGGKGNFLYSKVMVVGHSLGTVISYDVLNWLVLQDELAAMEGRPKEELLEVADRTKLMLTFGSPLDKVAFLFRTKGNTDELREAAAAAWQPLIRKYGFRPAEWVNIWSWFDIVSANLRFYDDPSGAGAGKRVVNKTDPEAFVPLVAHTEYWNDDLLGDTMYGAL